MIFAGGSIGEFAVKAGALNQTFVGKDFGVNRGASVLYGKVGAIQVYETTVILTLAGVDAEEIQLDPSQELFFT